MSKYHARKSSLQSQDQRGNSSPYSIIFSPGGAFQGTNESRARRRIQENHQQGEAACPRITLCFGRARRYARKVRINGMTHVSVDGLCLAWTSPPSRAASLVCRNGKKCDQTHLRFSPFPTAKTCRRFIFFTAHGKRRY